MIIKDKELLTIIQNTLNEIDERLINHGFRVAYLLREMMLYDGSFSDREIRDMTMAAMLHDIGAYKTDEIDSLLQFETKHIWKHAIYGYLFLKHLSPLGDLADVVLYHHVAYQDYPNYPIKYQKLTQLLSIADRLDVFLIRNQENLHYHIADFPTSLYDPELTKQMCSLIQEKNLLSNMLHKHDEQKLLDVLHFNEAEIRAYIRMISFSIDFQSKHMVAHTITTTSIATSIAHLNGLAPLQIQNIEYGAYLHDIGKVATPVSILEKPGRLTATEMDIMRQHVVHSIHILKDTIDPVIVNIAVRHHEKLNGKGYPYGLKANDLTLEERILAVADIFSALSGKRSYKHAFDKEAILNILQQMAIEGAIDAEIVNQCHQHFDYIMEQIQKDCFKLLAIYQNIETEYRQLLHTFK